MSMISISRGRDGEVYVNSKDIKEIVGLENELDLAKETILKYFKMYIKYKDFPKIYKEMLLECTQSEIESMIKYKEINNYTNRSSLIVVGSKKYLRFIVGFENPRELAKTINS